MTESTHMIAPLKPGAALPHPNGPVIETARLILRQWCGGDIVPYTAMLADPDTPRFITVDGLPVTEEMVGWRHTAVMAGHWTLHGAGMFWGEGKETGGSAGGAGPGRPPAGPAFRIGW